MVFEFIQRNWPQKMEEIDRVACTYRRRNEILLNDADRGKNMAYATSPVSGRALAAAGMDLVFSRCLEKGLITSYKIPGEEDDLPAEFSTASRTIAQSLERMVLLTDSEPLKHQYVFTCHDKKMQEAQDSRKVYIVKDRTRYVKAVCEKKSLSDSSEKERIDIITEGLQKLKNMASREARPAKSDSKSEDQSGRRKDRDFLQIRIRCGEGMSERR